MRIAKAFVQQSEEFAADDVEVEFVVADTDGRKLTKSLKDGNNSDYFILNLSDDGGYVIVSGDDRFRDVLGYSNEGSFSFDTMPDGLAYMLSAYSREMDAAKGYWETNDSEDSPLLLASAYPSVPPLVKTHWHQAYPFNAQVPIPYSGSYSTHHGKASVGCVALAMAQVMNYWKYPSEGSGGIYHNQCYDDIAVNFDEQTYDWNNVADEYGFYMDDDGMVKNATYTQTQADEVAKLCYHLGVAVDMAWNINGTGGSGAYEDGIVRALAVNFGYNSYAKLVYRNVEGVEKFSDMIARDIVDGRPVIFSANSDAGGGHSFIMDGYDSSACLFHVNWGWQGADNGYYAISVLQPSNMGNFIEDQSAILGLQPTEEDFGYDPTVFFQQATLRATSVQKGNNTAVDMPYLYCHDATLPSPIQIGFVVCDNNGVPVADSFLGSLSPVLNYIELTIPTPVFPKSMTAGTYTMRVSMKDADGKVYPVHAYYGNVESWTITVSSSAPGGTVSFVPIDPIVTSVDNLLTDDGLRFTGSDSDTWYTLTGIPVSVPQKGMYIRGGKKYLFR